MTSNWFHDLTGLTADDPKTVREGLVLQGDTLFAKSTGRRLGVGQFHTPSLRDLSAVNVDRGRRTQVQEIVADVRYLHEASGFAGAVFQVASQFNLLEMISPSVTPEDGIARYAEDPTQGPACAMCCGAGTLYRNYFVPTAGGVGQSAAHQLDMAADLHAALGGGLWDMRNGYLLPHPGALDEVNRRLAKAPQDAWRQHLRVGLQQDTEVTLPGAGHRVTQVYCSAVPVAYGRDTVQDWAPLGQIVLDAAYEATLAAGLSAKGPVFLTLLGGGAFGNPRAWIMRALERALRRYAWAGLDVRLVSYDHPSGILDRLDLP